MKNENLSKKKLLSKIEELELDLVNCSSLNEKLIKTETHYTQILKHADEIFYILGLDGEIIYMTPQCEQLLGYTADDLLTMNWRGKLTDNPGNEIGLKITSDMVETGKAAEIFEMEFYHKNGNRVLLEVNEFPVFDENQSVVAISGAARDLTNRKLAEAALKNSEERLSLIIKGSSDASWDWDYVTQSVYYSPQWWRQIGYEPDELPVNAELWYELTHIEDRPEIDTTLAKALKTDIENYQIEFRLKHKDGHYVPVLSRGIILRDDSGKITRISGTNQDLTVQKQVEARLRKSESSFRFLAENARDMIYHMSIPDACYEYVSPASVEIFGYTAYEFYNTPLLIENVIHPDWREYFKNEWQNLLNGIISPFYEYQIIHKSGEVRWLNQSNTLIRDEQGTPAAIEGVVRDITERKLADKEIIETKEAAERYLDMAGSIIVSLDINGNIILVNQKGLEILEYENSGELIGKNWFDTCIPIEMNSEINAVFIKVINGELENVEHYENEVITKSGSLKNISWYNSLIKNDSGQIQYLLSSGNDISKRKLAEKKLQTSLDEKEVLLRELYHRTKNNMQVISSMLGLRAMSLDNQQLTNIFKDIENKIFSMSLVHKKLYESGDLSHINLREYLEELIHQLEQSFFISSRKLDISIRCANIQIVFETAVPFGIVINEIVTNAINHAFPDNRDGRINIDLYLNSNEEIILEIADNGIGIPKDFDPVSDVGFGLRTVQKIVESQLHGSMLIENRNGLYCRIMIQRELYDSRV